MKGIRTLSLWLKTFRRHDNCGCSVTYEDGEMRQDAWSKRTWQASPEELAERRELEEKLKPVRFSPEEAKRREASVKARIEGRRMLTNNPDDDILLLEATSPFKNPETPLSINTDLQSKHIKGGKRMDITGYLGKKVDLTCKDGKRFSGYVYDILDAEDSDIHEDCIDISLLETEAIVEIAISDIRSFTVDENYRVIDFWG